MKKLNLFPLFAVFCVLDLLLIAGTLLWFHQQGRF
jgi:hypothetical protein